MNQLESVFVEEDPIIAENNINYWQSLDGEIKKLKIGEVFQLENKTLSLSCIRCCETFQYFTEFSLHIQEHYLHGDIANLREVKNEPAEDIQQDDNIESLVKVEITENPQNLQIASVQTSIENDVSANFIDDSDFQDDFKAEDMDDHSDTVSDDESKQNIQKSEGKHDINSQSFGEPKTVEFVEGEHYVIDGRFKRCLTCDRGIERIDHLKEHLFTHVAEKNVICPVLSCLKAFKSIACVRKHCGKVHRKKLSGIEIAKAQQKLSGGAASVVKIRIRSNLDEANSMELKCTENPQESTDKMPPLIKCYKCSQCNKRFTRARYLQKHMRCVHALKLQIQSIIATQQTSPNDESSEMMHEADIEVGKTTCDKLSQKSYECFVCHKTLQTLNSLKKHFKLHGGNKYKCFLKGCDRIFNQSHYVMDHMAIVHGLKKTSALRAKIQVIPDPDNYIHFHSKSQNVSSFQCYLCGHEYTSKLRLRAHFKIHLNGPFICSHCGLILKSADTLRHHNERHQANPDAPIQCPRCDKTYPTRRYMLRHLRIMHANDREVNKPKCDKVEKIAAEMFDCEMDECERKFSSFSRMKQHLATHTKQLHICPTCGWTCKIKSNLNQHMKVHSAELKKRCLICDKLLSSRYLAEHLKIHNGLKPLQCDMCGKSFFNSQRLKRHVAVVHTRNMSHTCEICDKKFPSVDKLLIHRRNHDEKMDFVCPVADCQKGFYSIESLRKHSNAHYLEGHSIASLKLENEN